MQADLTTTPVHSLKGYKREHERTPKSKLPEHLLQELSAKDKQIEDLMLTNHSLRKRVAALEDKNTQLLKEKHTLQQSLQSLRNKREAPEASADLKAAVDYAHFIEEKMHELPVLEALVKDRIPRLDDFIKDVAAGRNTCLLQTLQVLSDIVVQETGSSCIFSSMKWA